jgi:hypothetical protein
MLCCCAQSTRAVLLLVLLQLVGLLAVAAIAQTLMCSTVYAVLLKACAERGLELI